MPPKASASVGRLGTYRYLDMDVTIGEALHAADRILETLASGGNSGFLCGGDMNIATRNDTPPVIIETSELWRTTSRHPLVSVIVPVYRMPKISSLRH